MLLILIILLHTSNTLILVYKGKTVSKKCVHQPPHPPAWSAALLPFPIFPIIQTFFLTLGLLPPSARPHIPHLGSGYLFVQPNWSPVLCYSNNCASWPNPAIPAFLQHHPQSPYPLPPTLHPFNPSPIRVRTLFTKLHKNTDFNLIGINKSHFAHQRLGYRSMHR